MILEIINIVKTIYRKIGEGQTQFPSDIHNYIPDSNPRHVINHLILSFSLKSVCFTLTSGSA